MIASTPSYPHTYTLPSPLTSSPTVTSRSPFLSLRSPSANHPPSLSPPSLLFFFPPLPLTTSSSPSSSFPNPSYQPPFDTHRWLVNRCGTEVTYIIDFYTGSSKRLPLPPGATEEDRAMAGMGMDLSFFLDVRPAVNGWEGLKMRLGLGRDFVEEGKGEGK